MLSPTASNLEHTAQVVSAKPDSQLFNSVYDRSKDNVQSNGVLGAVDKFAHEHPYAIAAAGLVVGAGVFALTRGKIAAVSSEALAPLARNTNSEFSVLNQAKSVFTGQRSSLPAVDYAQIRPAARALARDSRSLSLMTAETPGVVTASKTLSLGEAVGRVPQGMLSASTDAAIANEWGAISAAEGLVEMFGSSSPRAYKLYIHSGEKAAVDLSKAGPLSFVKTNARDGLKWPAVPAGFLDHWRPMIGDAGRSGYIGRTPLHLREFEHPFLSKINDAIGVNIGRYPFRVSPDIESPVAVLAENGFVRSLIIPRGTTKGQLSEAMTIASSADRMFMHGEAKEATFTMTKFAPGFIRKAVEVENRTAHEMMGYALKGSSDWLKGAAGNNYTRYLRDWHGNFTRADRTFLHKLLSNERILARQLPGSLTW